MWMQFWDQAGLSEDIIHPITLARRDLIYPRLSSVQLTEDLQGLSAGAQLSLHHISPVDTNPYPSQPKPSYCSLHPFLMGQKSLGRVCLLASGPLW